MRNVTSAKRNSLIYTEPVSFIIPAAGVGSRMKHYGAKGLVLIGGISILERQVRTILSVYPNAEIIICIGFEDSKVRNSLRYKYPIRFVSNPNYENTNVLRSIGFCLQASIRAKAFIIYGDLVFNSEAIRGVNTSKSTIVIDNNERILAEEVGVNVQDGVVTNLAFGIVTKWAQITYLMGDELKNMEKVALNQDNERWFGYEGINKVIDMGGKFVAVEPPNMKLVEVDRSKDIDRAEEII